MLSTVAACAPGEAPAAEAGAVPADEVDTFVVAGQPAMVIAPGVGPLTGLVLYLHGLDDNHNVLQEGAARQRTVNHLVSSGYVVAASNAHLNAFGNEESQDDYVALAERMLAGTGLPGRSCSPSRWERSPDWCC